MEQYRLVVLDLDGTLTNNKKEITPRTKAALLRYQEQGGRIVLASGRPTYGVWPLAEELELDRYGSYILSFNGAVITECRTGTELFRRELPADVPALLASMAAEYGTSLLTYQDKYICTETPDDIYVQKEVICTKMEVRKLGNFARDVNFPVVKCMLMEREAIWREWRSVSGSGSETGSAYTGQNPTFWKSCLTALTRRSR